MIIMTGAGEKTVLLNTDKILKVAPDGPRSSWVTFTNGTRDEHPVTFADLEHVPGFHVLRVEEGKSGIAEVMVNLNHLNSASPTNHDDFTLLRMDSAIDWNAGYSNGARSICAAITLDELSALLRPAEAPAPGM